MLDLKFIRKNPELVKQGIAKKGAPVDIIDKIVALADKRRDLIFKFEQSKSEQNKISTLIPKLEGKEREEKIQEAKELADKIEEYKKALKSVETELYNWMLQVPNLPRPDVPEGKDESDNVVLKYWGEPPKLDFQPKDHVELGESLDLIDIERGVKASETRFYYLKNEAVLLEFALINFVMNLLIKEGFVPVVPPVLVNERVMVAAGYLIGAEQEIYKTERDNLYLVGTSEQSILPMHADEILDKERLPLRYTGFSTCFRREAGSYGRDVRGIFRVHQFDKVEMFSFCLPQKSEEEHQLILSIEERIMQALKIPYRVVIMCAGDLGVPAAKKYDIEAWMPGEGRYRETHSCSNCTDFQARRLAIRYREEKRNEFVHTLNGTACAIGRTLIAILENYQQPDGSVKVPEVLRPYVGFEEIRR